jgi:hypothetical protein
MKRGASQQRFFAVDRRIGALTRCLFLGAVASVFAARLIAARKKIRNKIKVRRGCAVQL